MGFLRRQVRRFARRLLEIAFEAPFEDIKRPRMVYDGWSNPDGGKPSGTRLSDTVFLYQKERITIGDHVFVWHNTILDGTGGLVIEEGCQIGAHVGIFTHSSHVSIRVVPPSADASSYHNAFVVKPVRIGKHTFIASGATVLAGVTIGRGCIIGAGSVVASDVPDFTVVMGNPGTVTGDSRTMDKLALRRSGDPALEAWYRTWQEAP